MSLTDPSHPLLNALLSLGQAAGLNVCVADRAGRPIAPSSLLPGFCAMVRQTPVGRARCEESYRSTLNALAGGERISIAHTCHAGLAFVLAMLPDAADQSRCIVLGRKPPGRLAAETLDQLANALGMEAEALRTAAESLEPTTSQRVVAAQAHLESLVQWESELRTRRAEATSLRMELVTVAQVGERLGNAPLLGLFLQQLLQLAVEMIDARAGLIALVGEASEGPRTVATVGVGADLAALQAAQDGTDAVVSVLSSGEPLVMTSADLAGRLAVDSQPPALPACVFWVPMKSAGEVVGVLSVGCAEPHSARDSMLYFTLLQLLAVHGGVAVNSAALQRQLLDRERVATRLLDATIRAQEEERERICLDIHDGVAQTLVGVLQHLEAASSQPGSVGPLAELVEKSIGLLRVSVREVREIVRSLRPASLDKLGLVATLGEELALLERELGWQTELRATSLQLGKETETALYRILHEAITNARKHSQTKRLCVRLRTRKHSVVGEVQDWGRGFAAAEAREAEESRQSIGLLSMRKRAELLGGYCEVVSEPESGTLVRVELPSLKQGRESGPDIRADRR